MKKMNKPAKRLGRKFEFKFATGRTPVWGGHPNSMPKSNEDNMGGGQGGVSPPLKAGPLKNANSKNKPIEKKATNSYETNC